MLYRYIIIFSDSLAIIHVCPGLTPSCCSITCLHTCPSFPLISHLVGYKHQSINSLHLCQMSGHFSFHSYSAPAPVHSVCLMCANDLSMFLFFICLPVSSLEILAFTGCLYLLPEQSKLLFFSLPYVLCLCVLLSPPFISKLTHIHTIKSSIFT